MALGAGYVASEISAARIEERVMTLTSRVTEVDARTAQRRTDAEAAFSRLDAQLRANDLLTAQQGARLDGLLREFEQAEKRNVERSTNTLNMLIRLQERLGGRTSGDDPWNGMPEARRAILRREDDTP